MEREKVAIIGRKTDMDILNKHIISMNKTEYYICFIRQEAFLSLVSRPVPPNRNLHNLAIKNERQEEETLFNSCIKDAWNLLLACCPDIILLDFFADIMCGVLEVSGKAYITNYGGLYEDNPLFESFQITDEINIQKNYERYLSVWKKSFDRFVEFIENFLPNARIIINNCPFDSFGIDKGCRNEILLNKAYREMLDYVTGIHKCFLLTENKWDGSTEKIQVSAITKYNLIMNSDFRSGTLLWKKWDWAYHVEGSIIKFHDVDSEKDRWHLLLSNEIEIIPDTIYYLSFECKVIDSKLMRDRRIFTIRSWDRRNCTGLEYSKDNIEIYYENAKCDGSNFYKYEISFIPTGRILAVGPEIRQKGIVEYRNIMLTIGSHDNWNTSYVEYGIIPQNEVLIDINQVDRIYREESEKCNVSKERVGRINGKKTIAQLDRDYCYGCGSCQNICPNHAIEMKDITGEGFLYPVICQQKCIECGLCAKACPSLNRYNGMLGNPQAYAVKTEAKIAEGSSSAGIFYILAKYCLEQGGYICGAIFDDKYNVRHIITNDWDLVLGMRKSKYVQSNMGNTYAKTKEKLESGVLVLFTGTPCQVAGLYRFLGKKYENLLTMDLICHGVPSPQMWRKYLDENWETHRLENIDFRYRGSKNLYGSQYINFTFKNGNKKIFDRSDNIFYTFFLANLGLRSSCGHCEYAVTPRAADFSVGDWWGIQSAYPELIDEDKASLMLINSGKAYDIFRKIKKEFKFLLVLSKRQALLNNRATIEINMHSQRSSFFELIKNGNTFQSAVRKSLYPQYDIILVGSILNGNYGAIMTNYALYKVISNAGYNIAAANYPSKNVPLHCKNFYNKYIKLAPAKENNREYNWMTDTFLLGSDQLWNYACFKSYKLKVYFDFVHENKKRISYATSYGFDYLTMYEGNQSEYPLINSLMKRFDNVSTREYDGCLISEREFSIKAKCVLDPVFLLEDKEYSLLTGEVKGKKQFRYATSYFLSSSSQSNSLILYVSNNLKLPVLNMLSGNPLIFDEQKEISIKPICDNLTMEEWLYNIQNCEFVVTDSFHCTCFAIIFKKNFVVMQKRWALSRLTSLLNMLGLQDRLIYSYEELTQKKYLLDTPIEYKKVYNILDKKRIESLKWLFDSLDAPPKVREHLYITKTDNILEENILRNVCSLSTYIKMLKDLASEYVVISCTHGTSFSQEQARIIAENFMAQLHKPESKLYEADVNMLMSESINVTARGNGRTNCRTLGIKIKESEAMALRQNPHEVYSISFDWNTKAVKGKFKIQLGQMPWDNITEEICVSSKVTSGHYENIYISSSKIDEFALGELQVRTDDLDGDILIRNLNLQKGNRPLAKYSASKRMNGFAMIYDGKTQHLDISITSIGKLEYHINGMRILLEYSNQGYRNCCPISELYVDNIQGRDIYPLKKDGLYVMLYSKENGRIVDISFVDDTGTLFHM